MHFSSTIVATLALFGSISALPTSSSGSSQVEIRDEGCKAPGESPPKTPDEPSHCEPGRIVAPPLISLSDARPDEAVSDPSGNALSLSLGVKGQNRDQVALFRGIPSNAKGCTFGWKQRAANTPDTFKAESNALVEFHPLPSTTKPFTFSSAKRLLEEEEETPGKFDLTGWDDPDFEGSKFHLGGGDFECAEEINLHLSISALNGETGGAKLEGFTEGSVEELQGVFIEWTC